MRIRTFKNKHKTYILSLVIIILAAITALTTPKNQNDNGNLKVAFIDVGQGDCSLISIDDKTLLVDGGEYECWEEDIKPYMAENGIDIFSSVMTSHYHSDHGGGIYELIEEGRAGRLIIPDTEDTGTLKNKLTKLANRNNIEIMSVAAGNSIDIGHPDMKLEVLFPDGSIYANVDKNINNDSIILRLDYFDTSFLFTGDLEEEAEMVLVNSGRLDADVLKVGHHGSKTSTSKEFLEAVSPAYAIIEVGENNSYGHPHSNVVKRIRDYEAMIYRTDRNGDIVFEVNEKGILNIETQY